MLPLVGLLIIIIIILTLTSKGEKGYRDIKKGLTKVIAVFYHTIYVSISAVYCYTLKESIKFGANSAFSI